MKELSIEEKAKAYDEAIERAKEYLGDYMLTKKEYIEKVFPVLKESDEEKIKKSLIRLVKAFYDVNFPTPEGFTRKQLLSWIKEHGEQKETLCDKCKKSQPSHSCQDITALGRCALEKQGEQKSNMLKLCEIEHVEHGKFYYCIKDYYSGGKEIASKGDVVQALKGTSIMGLGVKANEYFLPVYNIKQKPAEWSEEDKKILDEIYEFFDKHKITSLKHGMNDYAKFIKSLRSQWRPSEEQIEALESTIPNCAYSEYQDCLKELVKQLKEFKL